MRRRLPLVGTASRDLPGPTSPGAAALVALRKYSVPPKIRGIGRSRSSSGPNGEAKVSVQQQIWVRGVELHDRHWQPCGQRSLRDCINLSAKGADEKKRGLVLGDVDAVRIGTDLRKMAKTWAPFA